VSRLVIRERSNGVVAWASYFVVDELLARCADTQTDPARARRAAGALRKLKKHCAVYDGHDRINFLFDPRFELASILFGVDPPVSERKADIYGTVINTVVDDPGGERRSEYTRHALAEIREAIRAGESTFTQSTWEMVQRLVPDAPSWTAVRANPGLADTLAKAVLSDEAFDLCAELFVSDLADLVGISLDDRQIARAATQLTETFPLGMRTLNALLSRVFARGIDVSKGENANTMWDMQLAMSIPASSRITQSPVWLVTGDGLLRQAAADGGASHIVHDLNSYLDLTRDGDALRAMISRF
jgi:hypothetical protein